MVFCGPAMLHDIVPTLCAMLDRPTPETAAGKALDEIIS